MSDDVTIRIKSTADTSGVEKTKQSLGGLSKQDGKLASFGDRLNRAFAPMAALSAAAGIAVYKMGNFMGDTVSEANRLQMALTGLNSIARAFGQDADRAKNAANSLAQDGLMTVADAATGLKNLLASGFSLDQAVKLMERFKDTAAFGRQSALSFGQAVSSATEGIKNGNSILVDNAGVTKNLSVILTEAGFSAQDLMRATTDASIRQALFNGILKESEPMLGDAARLTELYAGEQAVAAAQTTVLKQNIGVALQQALLPLLKAITPIIVAIGKWVSENQKLSAGITVAVTVMLGLIAILGVVVTAAAAVAAAFGAVSAGVIAAVVAIVVAVGAAVGYMLTNFERTKRAFASVVSFIRAHWAQITWILIGPVAGAIANIINRWNSLTSFFRRVPGTIRSAMAGVTDAITSPFVRALNTVRGIASSISGTFNSISNRASELGNRIRGAIPGFAGGVRNFSGGLAVVGERGPELVNLPKGSDVFSNDESRKMVSGGGASNSYHIEHVHLDSGDAVREFFAINAMDSQLIQRGLTPNRGSR